MTDNMVNRLMAAVVFLVTLAVYLKTLSVTVVFWDVGEFLAAAALLQVPHPPGAPLFLLVGKVVSMVPFYADFAARIHTIYALAGDQECPGVPYVISEKTMPICRRIPHTPGRVVRLDPALPLAIVSLLFSCSALAEPPPSDTPHGGSVVIDTIGQLEGQRDPKCHATASRLEDFIYGTRLSEASRFLKNDLQKSLTTALWTEASERARQIGLSEIPLVVFNDARLSLLSYRQLENGNWQIESRGEKIQIDATDKRQYSTIAYSLRALLAAEQDQLLDASTRLLPLLSARAEQKGKSEWSRQEASGAR